jgi:hypothetical protein
VSFQITILKVLAGQPGGHASLGEVRHAVSLLISSGADWTNRMRRLAALAPELDIFGQKFVVLDSRNWQITEDGRRFLTLIETAKVPIPSENSQPVPTTPLLPAAPLPLIGINWRRVRRGRSADRLRRSA